MRASRAPVSTHQPLVIVAVLALSSCGGPQPRAVAPHPAPAAALCRFEGAWTNGALRALAGGYEFVRLSEAQIDAQLDRADGPLRFRAQVTTAGWHFVGRLDPDAGDGLRVSAPTPLHEGVILSAGAEGRVLDARPGEVLLGLPQFAPGAEDGFRFTAPVERWVPCSSLGFSFRYRGQDTDGEERAALGLPIELPERFLAPDTRASLANRPGGEPFLEIVPREHAAALRLIAEDGAHSRVLIQHWTGVLVLGWLSSSAIAPSDAEGMGGMGGILGALAGPRTVDVCVSPERLAIFASQAGRPLEQVGWVDPGVRFERGEPGADGAFLIHPAPGGSAFVSGEGVVWMARASAPLQCTQEAYDPSAAFAALIGPPDATIAITATVTAATGVAGPLGGSCELAIEHFPSLPYPCRTQVRCGDRVLYGHLASNGAFECEVTLGETPSVRGRDPQTSASSGDGALIVDTTTGTLEIDDDAQGHAGAFHLEARIDSVVVR